MLIRLSIVSLSLLSVSQTAAWSPIPATQTAFGSSSTTRIPSLFASTAAADTGAVAVEEELTPDLISKLRYRELQSKLVHMGKPATGTTAQLRARLREAAGVADECVVNEDNMGDDCDDGSAVVSHTFCAEECYCWSEFCMKTHWSFG